VSNDQVLIDHTVIWVHSSFALEGNPDWTVLGDGLYSGQSVVQNANSVPTAIIGDSVFGGVDYTVRLIVNDGGSDDDYIGVVFGYDNSEYFYVAEWKHTDIGTTASDSPSTWDLPTSGTSQSVYVGSRKRYVFAQAGLTIKRIKGAVAQGALWNTYDAIYYLSPDPTDQTWYVAYDYKPETTTIYHDDMRRSWYLNTTYELQVEYRPEHGMMRISIFDVGVSTTTPYIDTGAIYEDPSLTPTGKIGMYTFSQSSVTFDDLQFSCCDGYTDANAILDTCFPYTSCSGTDVELYPPSAHADRVCVPPVYRDVVVQVLDSSTFAPVVGATVTGYVSLPNDAGRKFLGDSVTDSSGMIATVQLLDGNYEADVTMTGYTNPQMPFTVDSTTTLVTVFVVASA
jgi:hypothetical protein